jgi:hypothetical protein
VTACRIVKAFNVVADIGTGLIACSVEKKLSAAAVSQTLPDLRIEQVTPLSSINRWNSSLVS